MSVFSQDTIPQKEPGYLVVAGGLYSFLDLWASTGFVNLQVQPGTKLWVLHPLGGIMVSFSGGCMVYGGLTYPVTPVKWVVIQTGVAVGYYESGKGIRLGFPLEFRISLSILYRFRNFSQLGMEFAHISNANLSTHNPGTESLSVIFQFPMRKRKAY
jgi:Lipid A 3-O-deacylase (PagL)